MTVPTSAVTIPIENLPGIILVEKESSLKKLVLECLPYAYIMEQSVCLFIYAQFIMAFKI